MNPDKLDSKVKESLQNMEVPFDPSGWDRLERSLDARGKAGKFNFKWNWKYSLNSFVGLAAVSALTWYVLSDKTTDQNNVVNNKPTPVVNQNNLVTDNKSVKENPITPGEENPVALTDGSAQPSPVYYATWPKKNDANSFSGNGSQMSDNEPSEFSDEVRSRHFINNPLMRGENLANPLDHKSVNPGNKEYPISKEELSKLTSMEYLANQRTYVFGDQIDPKKGNIYSTKEDDSIKWLLYLKQKEEQDKKEQEEWEKKMKEDSASGTAPKTTPDITPKKKRDKKSRDRDKKETPPSQDGKDVSGDNPTPSGDGNTDPEKKEEPRKKRDDKPKIDGRDKDPLNPYRN